MKNVIDYRPMLFWRIISEFNTWGFMNEITPKNNAAIRYFCTKNLMVTRILNKKIAEQVHGLVLLTFEQTFLNFIFKIK